jgi:hypothetical protein
MNNIKIFDNHIWIDLYSPTYSVKILNTNIESMIKSENYELEKSYWIGSKDPIG